MRHARRESGLGPEARVKGGRRGWRKDENMESKMLRRRRRRRRRVHRPSSSSQRPSASHSLLSSLFSLQASDDTITSPNHVLVLVHGASSEVTERAKESEAFLPLFFETDEFNRLEFVSPFSSPSLERKTLSLSLCVCVCVCVLISGGISSRRAGEHGAMFRSFSEQCRKKRERNKKRRRKINKHSFRRPLLFFLSLFQKGKKIFCTLPSLPHAKRTEEKHSLALRVLSESQHTACKRGKHTSKINEKEIGFAFTRRTPKL